VALTASTLRKNIYRTLDHVLDTGVPVEVIRGNRRLRIVPVEKRGKLANLKKRPVMKCDPEELVHIDWSGEWKP
jgi:hypothetical protein